MLCQNCKINDSTIHLYTNLNGKRVMLLLYYLFAHNKRELFYENLLNMP
ncbi:ATP-dependent Clp protease, ATP-binding subunit [Streptococcus pneumoniae]|nr:ATP-dependent Clp protease, ATP-binding subunit [Streptococcus pneumoniae]